MSRHKAPLAGKRRKVAGGARRATRPRYRRIGMASGALGVTFVTLLGGLGVIPVRGNEAAPLTGAGADAAAAAGTTVEPAGTNSETTTEAESKSGTESGTERSATSSAPVTAAASDEPTLPEGSGSGRRAVFDLSDQRVWIVGADGTVRSTYLVSGSVTDNLRPGSYEVYSRSRWAVGIDDSGVMQYFVRFTHGDNAAIGFHSIPTKNGEPLQTRAQLGTPQSHGCIRQALPDAIRMWRFAQVGTSVVVTA